MKNSENQKQEIKNISLLEYFKKKLRLLFKTKKNEEELKKDSKSTDDIYPMW